MERDRTERNKKSVKEKDWFKRHATGEPHPYQVELFRKGKIRQSQAGEQLLKKEH